MSSFEQSIPSYTLPDHTIVPSDIPRDHGDTPLYAVTGDPGLVCRRPFDVLESYGHELQGHFTEALFRLDEEYGIGFPGIASSIPERHVRPDRSVQYRTFTAAGFVDGEVMRPGSTTVGQPILLDTFDRVIRYYEDASVDESDRLYLTDLRLSQCVFGILRGETGSAGLQERVYFIDYDAWLGNKNGVTSRDGPSFQDALLSLTIELMTFDRRFWTPQSTGLKRRLATVGRSFDAHLPYGALERP